MPSMEQASVGPPIPGHYSPDSEKAPAEAAAVEEAGAGDARLVAPQEECSVCLNDFERPTITPCSHWFCRYWLLERM